jgi:hypothetical protein
MVIGVRLAGMTAGVSGRKKHLAGKSTKTGHRPPPFAVVAQRKPLVKKQPHSQPVHTCPPKSTFPWLGGWPIEWVEICVTSHTHIDGSILLKQRKDKFYCPPENLIPKWEGIEEEDHLTVAKRLSIRSRRDAFRYMKAYATHGHLPTLEFIEKWKQLCKNKKKCDASLHISDWK